MNAKVDTEPDLETIIMRDLIRINQPIIGKEEIDAATEVLKSGILTEKSGMGPRVLEFEKDFAALCRRQARRGFEHRYRCPSLRCRHRWR